jgi:hypothetical protein
MNFFQDTTLQPSSIKILNLKLNEWISFFPKSQQSILNILMFPDNANKILLESVTNKSNTNLHNFYTAINAVINHSYEFTSQLSHKQLAELKKEWCKIRSDNQKPIVQRRLELLPTENQLQKGGTYLKYDDILKKRDSLPSGSIEKLLISFYTYIPPVRADYYATEIITLKQKPTQPNYIRRISPTHSVMTLTDFKTKNRYTEITNVLPQELNDELVKSLEKSPRKYIFTNQTGQPFTRNAFTVWSKRILSRVFETEMTLIIIRHLFISSLDFTMKPLELKKISDKMGHDLSTQSNYKWDVSQLNTKESANEADDDED